MSKNAEQAGLIAYPVNNIKVHQGYNGDFVDYDKNKEKRELFVEGYNQAEKDLMEKFKMWVAYHGYTAQESELVYNDFKQFITEN